MRPATGVACSPFGGALVARHALRTLVVVRSTPTRSRVGSVVGRRGPRRRHVVVSVLIVLVTTAPVLTLAPPAMACSCPASRGEGDLRRLLKDTEFDGAFVGREVSRESIDPRSVTGDLGVNVNVRFEVEVTLKGAIPPVIDVVTSGSGASCGFDVAIGRRVGLLVDELDGRWRGSLCGVVDPDDLINAAKPVSRSSVGLLATGLVLFVGALMISLLRRGSRATLV
jgi:hypothetical protein